MYTKWWDTKQKTEHRSGFTIVELLIVIVVIGILAAITIVAYNGIQDRAIMTKRNSDMQTLYKAITLARVNQDKSLGDITGYVYLSGRCAAATGNPGAIEPKDLPKTHICWTTYYTVLTALQNASGVSLAGLREGDSRGNPYVYDENEGEGGNYCSTDSSITYFTGSGVARLNGPTIPKYYPTC